MERFEQTKKTTNETEKLKMKNMKLSVMSAVFAATCLVVTGCGSLGGSYEKHYTNPLANGSTAIYDTNGMPVGPINGSESYEHHSSWDLNPFVWMGSFLKAIVPKHIDTEVVVQGGYPQPGYYYLDSGEYVYYDGGIVRWYYNDTWVIAPRDVVGHFHSFHGRSGAYRGRTFNGGGRNYYQGGGTYRGGGHQPNGGNHHGGPGH